MVASKYNPKRHMYMHHTAQQQFDSFYAVGEFPEADIIAEKQPNKEYLVQAVDHAFRFLAKRVPGFQLTLGDWQDSRHTSWQLHDIENIDEIKFEIFDYLADTLIIKESKFRPRVEQRLRKAAARQQLGAVSFSQLSLNEFFEYYNTLVWVSKEQSNWFRASAIPGEYSALENEQFNPPQQTGIADLEADTAENNNIFNRLLKALHKA